MDWKEALSGKEAAHYKRKYERTVKLCKCIVDNWDTIDGIKYAIRTDDFETDSLSVHELWNELDYPVQKLLITAPLYGGPFTTAEVKKIRSLWEISTDDIEALKEPNKNFNLKNWQYCHKHGGIGFVSDCVECKKEAQSDE